MRLARAAGVVLLACGSSPASAPAPGCELVRDGHGPQGTISVQVERIATGLEVPWALAFLPGGDVLVTERPGRVRLLRQGRLEPDPVTTLAVAGGEGGLLGVAADPRFAENRRFYLYATVDAGGPTVNQVSRWVLSDDGRSARREQVILDGIAGARVHDGGRIRFGPDGMLYVGTGDAGEPDRAQDPASPNGKLLRVTPEGGVPADNPIPGSPVLLSGLRNVQAFDWLDPRTLVVTDHGPSGELGRRGQDEVTVAAAGANLGWPLVSGCDASPGTRAPLLSWDQAAPPGGGSLYRGDAVPAWKGSFLMGVLGARHLHRIELGPDGSLRGHEVYLSGDPPGGLGRLREVVQGPDGAVWVTTSNCDGRGICPLEKDVVARILAR